MKTFIGTPEERNAHSQGWNDCYEHWKHKIEHPAKQLSDEEIANVWLFLEGKAQGVLESGGTFNFPVEFYKAVKELEK